MKTDFLRIIFYSSIICVFGIIPKWNIEKQGEDLLKSSSFYQYQTLYNISIDNVELKMDRTIHKENNNIYYNNSIYMSYDFTNQINKSVPFDYIESHYIINGQFIVCPKGAHHPYNLGTQNYEIPEGFIETGLKNWDLKCIKPTLGKNYLFILYLSHGENYFFYRNLQNGETGYIRTNDDELYGMRVNNKEYHPGKDGEYDVISLVNYNKNLLIKGKVFFLENGKGTYDAGKTFELCPVNNYTRGFFSNDNNSFYFITYNDINNFISGYFLTDKNDINIEDLSWVNGFINNTKSPFEFIEEVEIEDIDFMIYNKFVYYKIKNKNNNKIYHGVLDVVENKVVFNTDEEINNFLPFSKESILAITPTKAYKICIYKNSNNECVEKCDNGYKLNIDGNTCGSSSSCIDEGKLILIPNEICIESCDTNIYIKNNTHCGLCKDFNTNGKLYKLINGTNCIDFDETSMEYYNEHLKLLKCKPNYEQKDDKCVSSTQTCYKSCETCSQFSDDENKQFCLTCKDKLNLEKGNCKENCSERHMALNQKCVECTDDICLSFLTNTCKCTKCQNKYFLNSSNLCEKCSEICGTCSKGIIGSNDNCDSCDVNSSYKYLINDTNNKTCVENCTIEGRKLSKDGLRCESLDNDKSGEEKSREIDYFLLIFLIVIGVILIIITYLTLKSFCCRDKNSGDLDDRIKSELIDKDDQPIVEDSK